MNVKFIMTWILIIPTVLILIYNAYVKLSSSPGAIQLFTGLGLEPYGRLLLGATEIFAALLIVYPPTMKYGAVLGVILMSGVILIHLTKLGIALGGDYSFFIMGIVAFCCSAALIWISYRK